MIQEPFAIGNSWLHRTDPRFKLVGAAVFSLIVASSHSYPTLVGALPVALCYVVLARLNVALFVKKLFWVAWFLIFLWLVLPVTGGGDIVFELGPIAVRSQGLHLSAQVSLKLLSILSALTALTATMPLSTTGHALHRLGLPEKLVHLLLMTYRYIFVIEQEYQRIFRAAKIRGFQPRTNLHTYKTYAYMIGMIFIRASERARRVQQAMLCRGFQGKFYCFYEFDAGHQDYFFAGFTGIMAVGMIILEWRGVLF